MNSNNSSSSMSNMQNEQTMPSGIGRFPKETPLAMAYVPFQFWETPASAKEGFANGSIFNSLVFPFERGMR